jgi:ABC-type multidrug transport system fused ATPase/permease subunit
LENIKFGRKLTDEQAIKAAQIAHVDEFAQELNMDTLAVLESKEIISLEDKNKE